MNMGRSGHSGAGSGPDEERSSLPFPAPQGDHSTEFADVSDLLDSLAALDRAAAPAGMESRVLRVVRASAEADISAVSSPADSTATESTLSHLVSADRDSAGRTLEDRIFAATRPIIVYEAAKAGFRTRKPATFMSSFAFRAAAGLLIGGGLIWTYLAFNPGGSIVNNTPANPIASIEQEFDARLSSLDDIFTLAMISTDADGQSSTSNDSTDLGDWPQFQFLEGGDS